MMCERLLRLQSYFTVLKIKNYLDKNLTDEQWSIINDVKNILESFKSAQELLKGEKYVTISLIPLSIHKIRTDWFAKCY